MEVGGRLTGTGPVQVTDDVTHTSLVTHDGGKVDRLGGVILQVHARSATLTDVDRTGETYLGERLNPTPMSPSTLLGQEPIHPQFNPFNQPPIL